MRFSSGDSDSGLLPLVQVFTTVACRQSTTADENARGIVVTTLKKSDWRRSICSIEQCYYALCVCSSFKGNRAGIIFGVT